MLKRFIMGLGGALLFSLILNVEIYAAIINAASCENKTGQTDIQNAVNAAGNRDIVSVPSGSCTWDTTVSITKQIILMGAGIDATTINCGSLTNCINMNVASDSSLDSATPLWKITGFTFMGGSGFSGLILVNGTGRNWRIDHNKFYNWTTSTPIYVSTISYGLVDQNFFFVDDPSGTRQCIIVQGNSNGDRGYNMWRAPYTWGTADAVFFEDNDVTFSVGHAGWVTDGEAGGRLVVRYNTIWNGVVSWHGFDSGKYRGGIGGEVYNNTFTADNSIGRTVHPRSGILAFHDNIVKGGYIDIVRAYAYRGSAPQLTGVSWPPADGTLWGWCGDSSTPKYNTACGDSDGAVIGDAFCASQGAGTCYYKFCSDDRDKLCHVDADCSSGTCTAYMDGNGTNPAGYPLRDQPGIGPGGQIHQPLMAWGNSACLSSAPTCTPVPVSAGVINGGGPTNNTQENRDFFNCTSQSECETRVNTYLATVGQPPITYQQYSYPHSVASKKLNSPTVNP